MLCYTVQFLVFYRNHRSWGRVAYS